MPNALPIQLGPTPETRQTGINPIPAGKSSARAGGFSQVLSHTSHGRSEKPKPTSGTHLKPTQSARPHGKATGHDVKKTGKPSHPGAHGQPSDTTILASAGNATLAAAKGVPAKGAKGHGSAVGAAHQVGSAALSRRLPVSAKLVKQTATSTPQPRTTTPVTHVTRQGATALNRSARIQGKDPQPAAPSASIDPKVAAGHGTHDTHGVSAHNAAPGAIRQSGTAEQAAAMQHKSGDSTGKVNVLAKGPKSSPATSASNSTPGTTTAPTASPVAPSHAHAGHGAQPSHSGPVPAQAKAAPAPQPPAWKVHSNGVVAQDGIKRSSWTIQPPLAHAPAMKLDLTQSGSKLKADLTVSPQVIGLINASPTALPHHAVHLPEGVSTLEFSLFTQGGGAGFGDQAAHAGQQGGSGYTPAPYQSGDTVPLSGRPLEYAGTVNDGIDYRA